MKRGLRKKLDTLWSKKVRERDVWCSRHISNSNYKRLNAHHIIAKSLGDLFRWEVINGIALCVHCHRFGENSAHSKPGEFQSWYKKSHPTKWAYLQKRKNLKFSFKDWHYDIVKEAIEDLRPLEDIEDLLRG